MTRAGKCILVVEDDDAIRESIVELMTEEGYAVVSALNGSEGINHLTQTSRLPDLILVDLMMPVMDGFEFCLRKGKQPEWGHIPTVVMSADGHVREKQNQTGALEYIKKPLDIDHLIARVDAILSIKSFT